ncbi:hypothetical protein M8C21_026139 [Ambrosia artemisiifolia]|uniref:Uncharacterized protein n=1 Tax=Ambrosia artemisiifolia TaxID=4212 RepID=A0AAD5GYM2_AMBAR|nr:hypothetical protein M8C21_026139 [Ambrosia artemisiifolia]
MTNLTVSPSVLGGYGVDGGGIQERERELQIERRWHNSRQAPRRGLPYIAMWTL